MNKHTRPSSYLSLRRAPTMLTSWVLLALLVATPVRAESPTAEDVLAGVFDKTTGVPFASTMLAIIRQGASSQQDPAILDARLKAVEEALGKIATRLQLVEQRLGKLEKEVANISNVNRLRKLQQVTSDLAEINAELRTRPADASARAILEFRARQQADLIKNDPELDIWKMSDVTAAGIRTRFFVYPAFETYVLALTTWFSAIELNSGIQPQRVVSDFGPALHAHQAFLEARPGFRELVDDAITLLENLHTAAFCRLEAVDKFSNTAGDCVFASVCVDTMTETSPESGRLTLTMQPPKAGTLCTSNPSQSIGLKGEDELRKAYGAELMAELAHSLDRLATTGSLKDPFVGQFPNSISAQLFSVPLNGPVIASAGAAAGTTPGVPRCTPVIGGCSFGVKLSPQTAWTIANTNPAVPGATNGLNVVRHNGSNLCLDVKGSAAVTAASVVLWPCNRSASQVWNLVRINNAQFTLVAANTNLCATVAPAPPGNFQVLSRSLALQPCDRRTLQQFSTADSTIVPPH